MKLVRTAAVTAVALLALVGAHVATATPTETPNPCSGVVAIAAGQELLKIPNPACNHDTAVVATVTGSDQRVGVPQTWVINTRISLNLNAIVKIWLNEPAPEPLAVAYVGFLSPPPS